MLRARLKRATQGTSIRITGAAELELRPNPEERDVKNPEQEEPKNGTGHLQASPAGSEGHSLPPTAALLCIHILQSTYRYHCLTFGSLLSSVMMGTQI